MRVDAALADRNAAVRQAARDWQESGILSAAGLKAVEELYPDDRVRVGPVMRVLLFVFTLIAIYGADGFVTALIHSATDSEWGAGYATSSCLLGFLVLVATEAQIGPMKRRQGGSEAASSLAALTLLLWGVGFWIFGVLHFDSEGALAPFLLLVALTFLAGAWRWGYPLYGALATAALLGAVAYLPLASGSGMQEKLVLGVRVAWILLALAGIALLPRWSDSRRLPPAQREIAAASLLVLLLGLYLAVEISSFSGYWLEAAALLRFSGTPPPPPPALLRFLSMTLTALVPAGLVAWGLIARRRWVLLLGLVLAGYAAGSLRRFIHVAPLWVVLTLAGGVLLALAILVRRTLDRGPNQERSGLTAEPPLGGKDRARLIELIATTAHFTPEARDLGAEPAFQGKGGEFGGGGSTSDF